ncbi:MAG: bifunctional UDP-N-acetylmuramoyl-tripeptide:D-alanyl-D-alanine ligase/alanine racemase [Bacteroidota bacterium]
MAYSFRQIAAVMEGQVLQCPLPDHPVKQLLFDSRQLLIAEGSLFFAFRGLRQNGHHYINELYQQGIRHFIVSERIDRSPYPEANFLHVEQPQSALQALARWHRQQLELPVIGITGSNGKTIVKEWLYQLLQEEYNVVRSPRSYNSQLGVPLSVWLINDSYNLGLFEAGISRVGEMERLAPIIDCQIGLFTNIGAAHSEGFDSMEEKIQEKLGLFEKAETIVYCQDHQAIDQAIRARFDKRLFCWSRSGPADLEIIRVEEQGRRARIEGRFEGKNRTLQIPFADEASIENAIHCWAILLLLGIPQDRIEQRMQGLQAVAMRLELKAGINQSTLINDSYNSDLSSLEVALHFAGRQPAKGRSLILSDILESGISQSQLYQKVAQLLEQAQINRLFGIGRHIPQIRQYLSSDIELQLFPDTAHFLDQLAQIPFEQELILLKGARPFAFERIAMRLEAQAHSTVLEINFSALVHNLRVYSQLLKRPTKLMVMVKASGYGSGSIELARQLEAQAVDYLAVAYTDEGVELRQAGIRLPILVLNPEAAGFDALFRYQLEPEIYSLSQLKEFLYYLPPNQRAAVHIKLDTGMHRLGFEAQQLPQLIPTLQNQPQLEVRSIFSHLVASDAPEHDVFTHQQFQQFQQLYEQLAAGLGYRPLAHILNSAGIARFPQYQLDMVRLGIGLYGIGGSNKLKMPLQYVHRLKASISQIKEVAAAESIGYNRRGRADRPLRIATVSIGYADGLLRTAGNGRYSLLVAGKQAPIVGDVCMDMCMIDITEVPEARAGDEVIVFGEEQPVEALARCLNSIPYEVFTGISGRVKRIYFQE